MASSLPSSTLEPLLSDSEPVSHHYVAPANYQPGYDLAVQLSSSSSEIDVDSSLSPTSEFCRSGASHFVNEEFTRLGWLVAIFCFPCGIFYCLNRKQRVCIRCGQKFP